MGMQKKMCWKCNGRHFPPTGAKCDKTELYDAMNVSGSMAGESSAGSEREKDSYVIPSTSKAASGSSTQKGQEEIQKQIVDQPQRVNQCLDKVEDRMAKDQHGRQDKGKGNQTQKLSKFSKRQLQVESDSSQSSSTSSDKDQSIPSLYNIRQSAKIQHQVDARIRELEQQSQTTGSVGKIKSKRGGNVEVIVKHRVAT